MRAAIGRINLIRSGSIAGNGIIQMRPDPDYTRGKEVAGQVPVAAFPVKIASVELPATLTTGDVQMQGSNGGGVWHNIGAAVPASGAAVKAQIADDNPWNLVRFQVANYAGSGDVVVRLHATS